MVVKFSAFASWLIIFTLAPELTYKSQTLVMKFSREEFNTVMYRMS